MKGRNRARSGIAGALMLELLLSISLTITISGAILSLLHASVVLNLSAIKASDRAYAEARLKLYLHQAMHNLDSHRLPLEINIHKLGNLKLTDGSAIIPSANPDHAPSADSDAFTSLELDVGGTLILEKIWPDGRLDVCSENSLKTIPSSRLIPSWIAVGVDGVSEIQITSQTPLVGSVRCFQISITRTKSVSVPEFPSPLARWIFLLPIKSHFTIYMDITGQLRYLSHQGEVIIENQPIAKGIDGFYLVATKIGPEKTTEIQLQIKSSDDGKNANREPIFFRNSLGRRTLIQAALQ